jgi:hypothetical protein
MIPGFNYLSLIEDENPISPGCQGQAVRDYQHCPVVE